MQQEGVFEKITSTSIICYIAGALFCHDKLATILVREATYWDVIIAMDPMLVAHRTCELCSCVIFPRQCGDLVLLCILLNFADHGINTIWKI